MGRRVDPREKKTAPRRSDMPKPESMDVLERRPATGLVAVDGRTFPLESARVHARAEGGLALTVLAQEYANPHSEPLEVVYTLPLPADGAVVGYTIRLGRRVITGQVEKREAALADYRRALEEGRTAGLLDQERADTFTQTLGNLPPGERVRVEIEVLHALAFLPGVESPGPESRGAEAPGSGAPRRESQGAESPAKASTSPGPEWEYRFPTVVGVRYEGAPGRVPDADALESARADAAGTPVRLEAEIFVADALPDRVSPCSPSHSIASIAEERGTRVSLASPSRLDRDLVVRWAAAGPAVGARLAEGDGLPGDSGRYGLVTLTPPAGP